MEAQVSQQIDLIEEGTQVNRSHWEGDKNLNQSYVPFLAKSNRFDKKSINDAPAIGTYNLPSCFSNKRTFFDERAEEFMVKIWKKKQQMGIFKSSLTRFKQQNNQIPGPASYNLFKIKSPSIVKSKNKPQKQKLIELNKSCPSIPDKTNKYGYIVQDGNLKTIQKQNSQIETEKQSMKAYVSTLHGESSFLRTNTHYQSNTDYEQQKKKLITTSHKFIGQKQALPLSQRSNKIDLAINRKPKYDHLYHSKSTFNRNHAVLGPGHYQVELGTLRINKTKQKYQFFGSSEVRFQEKKVNNNIGYSLIDMIKQNRKNYSFEGDIGHKVLYKAPLLNKKVNSVVNPGPGEYNPTDQILKKSRGYPVFSQEQRFKQNKKPKLKQNRDSLNFSNYYAERQKTSKSGNLRKQRFKPLHKAYEPVEQEQIYGILSQKTETQLDNNLGRNYRKNTIKVGNQGSDFKDLSSWRHLPKNKQGNLKSNYIKELKEELAIINHQTSLEIGERNML